jgi:hypothetical protein
MTAAGAAAERNSSDGVLLTTANDPGAVNRLCCGDGIPVVNSEQSDRREAQHHTDCPIYIAEGERAQDGEHAPLGGYPEDPPVETFATPNFDQGVPTYDLPEDW